MWMGFSNNLIYDNRDILHAILDASGQETTFQYNAKNRISSIKDPAGREVKYQYDAANNLIAVIDVGGFTTHYSYDSKHKLTSITDAAGRKTTFIIDGMDRLSNVSGINGNYQQNFAYGVPSRDQMTITDTLGNKTVLTYDSNESVTEIQDSIGQVSTFAYDANYNLTETTDANGNTTRFSYDSRGNAVSMTDPKGNSTRLEYEAAFNQIKEITDSKGNKTTFAYDETGNLISRTHPDGSKETLSYDAFGNLTSLSDAKNNTTQFAYDTQGNLTSMTYPDNSIEAYSYDANGHLSSKTARKNQTIEYKFDVLGRLLKKTFPDASSDTFTYDNTGNMLSAADENGLISFTYNLLGQLTQVMYPMGEQLKYAYNKSGNRSQLIYPEGTVLDYDYNSLNRLTSIKRDGLAFASYQYDNLGRIQRRELQNGSYTTYSYDKANQLLNLINSKSTDEIISQFSYRYDDVGNRLSMTTLEGKTDYQYDSLNQLNKVIRPDTTATEYDFDPSGNRRSVTENNKTSTYQSNQLNQYTAVDSDSYSYDANGNLTRKQAAAGVTHYSYDFENRLVQVDTPTETVKYAYDPLGRRIQKVTSEGETHYFHDGLHVVMEKDAQDAVQATYVFGIRIDEVLVMRREGVDYFYSQDGLGSVVDLTDISEGVVESYSYDAYGALSNVGTIKNPYFFTGREFEMESGLYFYRSRYYNIKLGRFISQDHIGVLGGINLYVYTQNNPIHLVDPYGFKSSLFKKINIINTAKTIRPHVRDGIKSGGFFKGIGTATGGFLGGVIGGRSGAVVGKFAGGSVGLFFAPATYGTSIIGGAAIGNGVGFVIGGSIGVEYGAKLGGYIGWLIDQLFIPKQTGIGGSDDFINCSSNPEECICAELDQQMCSLPECTLPSDSFCIPPSIEICDSNIESCTQWCESGKKEYCAALCDKGEGFKAFCKLADPGSGNSSGDPHLITFDGLAYDFQAVGEFVLAKSLDDDLEVQVRTKPWRGSRVLSVNNAVAVNVGGDRVGYYIGRNPALYINGIPTKNENIPSLLPHGGRVITQSKGVTIIWPDSSQLRISAGSSHINLKVFVARTRLGRMTGLLGNFDEQSGTKQPPAKSRWVREAGD